MILDLKGEPNMDPVVGMLYSMVDGNYTRLKSIVAGMSREELYYKGLNHKYNSTAQLLRHLAYVDLNWVFRIKGEVMPLDLKRNLDRCWMKTTNYLNLKGFLWMYSLVNMMMS
ncbi:hypothetical protein J2S10_004243 [Neobacillus ginsengisoli]|uniref:DUF664 domain-containing protein n=1 Tax=Neobacillus ginsengisoli TaxID=904295 RepID=A0ABT9XZM9_9BACI|nr:hypothetical protein [Neobacillus ginsengisoli]